MLPADFAHIGRVTLLFRLVIDEPLINLHKDHSPLSVVELVQLHMGERAAELLRGRVQVIKYGAYRSNHLNIADRCSFWKPISPYPVKDAPLALCDGTSVIDADFLTADHVRRRSQGETLLPLYRPGFRWHYLSNQKEHEGYLIKIFDSLGCVQAKSRQMQGLNCFSCY